MRSIMRLLLLASWAATMAAGNPLLGSPASKSDHQGSWVGPCEIDGRRVFVRLRLERAGASWRGILQVRALGMAQESISDVEAKADRLAFTFGGPGGPVRLAGTIADRVFEGTADSAGHEGRFRLRKRYPIEAVEFDPLIGNYELGPENFVLVGRWDDADYTFLAEGDRRIEIVPVDSREFVADDLRTIAFESDDEDTPRTAVFTTEGQTPVRAARVHLYDEQRVSFQNGDVRLAGSLVIPPGEGPFAALVFVHGSGPQTRESYRIAADRFARNGIACLFYDKRGTGTSSGDWRQVGFEALAYDALAGVKFLQTQPRIDAKKIGLWGISQAGWIIPLAAANSDEVAFIVPISGATVSPVEQEAWRRANNLAYLGVDERFVELGRKTHVMVVDWHRREQLGQMPLSNPFTDDELNMYHDAPAVLAKVKQPALVIYGALDTLAPPRESAAMWAKILRQSGHDDFSVRLFPRGTHGLQVGGKTGVGFEITPERRYVPGFWETMVAWIHHHTGEEEYADARRVDVDAAQGPIEARGMGRVSWYGSGAVQPWLLAGYLLVFGTCALAQPAGWLWRKARRAEPRPIEARKTIRWAALAGTLSLAVVFGLVYVLYPIVDAEPNPMLDHLMLAWNVLVAASWGSLVAGALFLRQYFSAWGTKKLSGGVQAYYGFVGLAVLSWAPFVYYWDLLLPAR